jgi:hypothetical protein
MPIQCSCPECGYLYKIADELADKTVLCPECQTRFKPERIPEVLPIQHTSSRRQSSSPRSRSEDFEEVPSSRKRDRFPWVLLAVIGIPITLFGVCGGLLFIILAGKSTTKYGEYNFGAEIRVGDLGVTVTEARVRGFTSTTAGGRLMDHSPEFVVTISFKNYNPNRIINAGSQVDAASLKDDVGNRYRGIRASNELGLTNHIDGQIQPGMARPVRSDEPAHDVLVFSRPVPGASALTLVLDASSYGGAGRIEIHIPKSVWSPGR